MKLGCHAAVFGRQRMATEPDKVFEEIASTGFGGFECNYMFAVGDMADRFNALLAKHGLEVAGLHFSGDWLGDKETATANIIKTAEYLQTQPNKNIVMSAGWGGMTGDQMVEVAKAMNNAALEAAKYGVRLNYHNHNGEFIGEAMPYKTLKEHAPDVFFGFDIGWAYKGGYNPIDLLKENRGRVSYVHLRDPQKLDKIPDADVMSMFRPGANQAPDPEIMKVMNFPDLGDGGADLKGQINFLNGYLPEDGWVVVEYETGEPDPQRYVRAKELIDELLLV